jgi:hypothetical protein
VSTADVKRIMRSDHLVTPKLTKWLIANGGPDSLDFTSGIMKDVMWPMLAERGAGRRQDAFHPSSLHQCLRKQVFDYLGVPGSQNIGAELRMIFLDGQWRHLRWQAMGLEAGIFNAVEVPISHEPLRLSGSADALGDDFLFELKGIYSIWQAKKNHGLPKPEHISQIHVYFYMLELTGSDIKKAALVYEDKQSQRWEELVINRDERIIAQVAGIVDYLNSCIDSKELPLVQKECASGKGAAFKGCPYSNVCLATRTYEQAVTLATGVPAGRGDAEPGRAKPRTLRIRRSSKAVG